MVDNGQATAGGFLFDTNIVIAAFGRDEGVAQRLEGLPADSIFIPSIVIGELFYGAYRSSRATENRRRIEEFVRASNVLPCDAATARTYGELKDGLLRKGRPIPENDIWIAAVAIQHDLTLVTRDMHFEHITELHRERW